MSEAGHKLQAEIESIKDLDLGSLRDRWRVRFKRPLPSHQSRDLLRRAYAFELQARMWGDLANDKRRRLSDLAARFTANSAHEPAPLETLKPGTVLVRDWNGRRYAVAVTEHGFLLDGQTYGNLSAVAFAITGTKWSGPRFFRETEKAAGP
jgi:hypothetical protein